MQVASVGHRYQIQENTHCFEDLSGQRCDPIYTNWVGKADVNATYRYMGLRRDPARADWTKFATRVGILLVPGVIEDLGEVIHTGLEVIEASSEEDIPAATRPVILLVVRAFGERFHPYLIIGAEVLDLGEDTVGIVESLGYRWVP